MPWMIRGAMAALGAALVCGLPVEYVRLASANGTLLEKVSICALWPCGLAVPWLCCKRSVWAGRLLALLVGLSMAFLRTNAGWLQQEGFVAVCLFSLATLLRFVSLILLILAKRRGWFPNETQASRAARKSPPVPVLQAFAGIALGLGLMALAGAFEYEYAGVAGGVSVAVGLFLTALVIKCHRQRQRQRDPSSSG
jgi:hypothetical protein